MPEDRLLANVAGLALPGGPFDLQVNVGEVVLVTGPNGSGKTSLLRALAGLPTPGLPTSDPASVLVGGKDPRRLPAHDLSQRIRLGLHDPRDSLVGLTVQGEARLRGVPVPEELRAFTDRDVATLSSGEARRVLLALLAAQGRRDGSPRHHPSILLLDEPSEGLDEAARRTLVADVQAAAMSGAVVVADHDPLLASVATRRVVLPLTTSAAGDTSLGKAPPVPPGSKAVLLAAAAKVRRGRHELRLPALELGPGVHVLAGPNGSGKSTWLLHLSGLLAASDLVAGGEVSIQDAAPLPGGNVRLLLPRPADLFSAESVADELAGSRDMGLVAPRLLSRHPLSLSAGEAQRVALSKTLGSPSPLVLLDEPEAHLDPAARHWLWRLLCDRAAAGDCILVATHDATFAQHATSVQRLGGP